jgi:hypothetical protein
MCNHLNLKILIHIFTIIHLIMIIIIFRGQNFVVHLDGLGGTPVAHHCCRQSFLTANLETLTAVGNGVS